MFGGAGGMGGAGFEDMLGQMFGGGGRRGAQFAGMGGNPFGSQSRGRQQQQAQRPKGRDINVSIDITTKEAADGGTFSFTFKRLKPNQMGTMEAKSVTLQTQLKAGVTHGTIKRMKGQGNDHPQGDSGDVILTVRIDAGEGRFWDGDVLVQEVNTPYSTLALGGKVKITLPSGKEGLLKVPPNTQVGDRRRMSKAGLSGGDLDLEFVLIEYEKLSKQQIKALEALRESGL